MMSLEGVIIEIRPNLRCANVFLAFGDAFTETGNSLSIVLKPKKLIIKNQILPEAQILLEGIEIDVNTLSALVIQGSSASFRVSLTHPTDIVDILVNGNSNFYKDNVKTNVIENEICSIACKNCENNLLQTSKAFNRVLELPSGSIEMNDWFCHDGPNFDEMLVPKLDDIFYGFYYIVLRKENVCNYKIKEAHAYCERCLQYIGQFIFSEKAIKIWSDCANLRKNDNLMNIFENECSDRILYTLIRNILTESNLNSSLLFIHFAKILLEAVFPNRKSRYVMINVIEKDLEILKNVLIVEDCSTIIKLVKCKCFKLLFKVEEDEQQPLLKFWQTDVNAQSVKLSYRLFSNILNILNRNTKFIPEVYRNSNGFLLTYIFYPL